MALPCSLQSFKTIWQRDDKLWPNVISRDRSLRFPSMLYWRTCYKYIYCIRQYRMEVPICIRMSFKDCNLIIFWNKCISCGRTTETGNVILMKLSSLAALEVVIMETYDAENDKSLAKMETFLFQWLTTHIRPWIGRKQSLRNIPENKPRNKHVIITSKHRLDVIITCLLHCVFAGINLRGIQSLLHWAFEGSI